MLNWFKSILNGKSKVKQNSSKTFRGLRGLQDYGRPNTKSTYELLLQLNKETPKDKSDELVSGIKEIGYVSNTNGFFDFYFPIVSHFLYFKPEYESQLLRYIIGPNFADGINEVEGMMKMITSAMNHKLSSNPYYLTIEGQSWVKEKLPNMYKEIQREIDICIKELND